MSISPPRSSNPKNSTDAHFMLAISVAVMLVSCGISYLIVVFHVLRIAKCATIKVELPSAVCLVFGKRLVNNSPDIDYRSRLNRLAQCHGQPAIIMGGKSGNADITEAQAGLDYLRESSFGGGDARLEQKSVSTLENLRNSRYLLNQQTAIIISNRYHLARCRAFALSLAIPHRLCAAESRFLLDASNISKCLLEAFYLHWFYTGKYLAVLIQSQRMLDKIS